MITKLTRHDNHAVRIHKTKSDSKHYAALRCVDCNTHIQWLSNFETDQLKAMGIEVITPWVDPKDLGI
jgi:hypothetical protein